MNDILCYNLFLLFFSLVYFYQKVVVMDSNFFGLNDFQIYKNNSSDSLHSTYQYKYAFPFEKIEDKIEKTIFFQNYWYHSITISVVYFMIINMLQNLMKNKEPLKLKYPLFLWNFSLAIFSIIGTIRFSEDFLHNWYTHGFTWSICHSCNPDDVAAFWSFAFCISKLVELGDTLFIILRKKPLIFLHYYHHAAVLVYTVHSGAEHTAPGQVFITMNYLAHSFMYSYYALTALGYRPPKFVSMCVTTIQTTQMFLGVATTFYVYKIKTQYNIPCQQSIPNLYLAFFIYATFGVLFVKFFVETYFIKGKYIQKERIKKD
uniref:Elongation of very long chain fatty acids protein n=1 Tax=Strongyloides venezuelensis TaxID=75913 RepID=A0A0K0FXQ2_STRVS